MAKKISEREELLWRVLVLIVTGIILSLWRLLILALVVVNFFVVLFSGKKNRDVSDFCDYWNREVFRFVRYITFVVDERPFPFGEISRKV